MTIDDAIAVLEKPVEQGGYKQCTNALRENDAFCVAGVLCDLSGKGKWVDGCFHTPHDGKYYRIEMPPCVLELYGLRNGSGGFDFFDLPDELQAELRTYFEDRRGNEVPGSLTMLNDWGVPFPVIAKVIKARPEGLFVSP